MGADILVVDDSPMIRRILARALRQAEIAINAIHEAEDGQQALLCLKTEKIHLVLTDISMPKMDGLQLLQAIKASPEWRDISVMMITTDGTEAKVANALRLGAAGYVRKPFTAEQIKEKLAGIFQPALP